MCEDFKHKQDAMKDSRIMMQLIETFRVDQHIGRKKLFSNEITRQHETVGQFRG